MISIIYAAGELTGPKSVQYRAGAVGMMNPKEQEQATSTQEPVDVWWPKYLALVGESVAEAEQHLEVPTGTISSIHAEPDFIAVVKAYAVVEPILNDLIAKHLPRPEQEDSFRSFVVALPMLRRTGKLTLAESLGLLGPYQIDFVQALTQVRNRYAHNVKNMHRSLTEILTEEQRGNGQIVKHLTGLEDMTLGNEFVKLFMYHRLSDYLASVLFTLKPPSLPEGGILGGLFETPPPLPEADSTTDGD
jgi:hypothetical protein